MADSGKIGGSIVALVTPMHEDGAIDWEAFERLIDWHVESGTDGIVAVGTTGESPTLSHEEHNQVVERAISHAAGRITVIAGTGANSTAEAVDFTSRACASGAVACLSVVPYYNKPTQQGLREHFTAVADAADRPLILYNVPSRTVTDLADETLAELAEHPRIAGIKDATGNIDRLRAQRELIGDGFSYLSGDDGSSRAYIAAGGGGVISVTANVAPVLMRRMVHVAIEGDATFADDLDSELSIFHMIQGVVANPMPVKWALHEMGRIGPGIRLPLTALPEEHRAAVRAAVAGLS